MFFRKKKTDSDSSEAAPADSYVFDVQWGGFYVTMEKGRYRVFRLLDFNKDVYHSQIFGETYEQSPSFDEIATIEPVIWHAPVAIGGLLMRRPVLIGPKELTKEALAGYEEYLRDVQGLDDTGVGAFVEKLIGFSKNLPMQVTLQKVGKKVEVTGI